MTELTPCPNHVTVIGGGRWARVLTTVLCDLVPPSVKISVHSFHNADAISTWVLERKLADRVHVSSDWPQILSKSSSAIIVANAARDHERAVEWAIFRNIPVLVEKPIALTAVAAQHLVNLALSQNLYFATAHVFLFARYVDNFVALVGQSGNIQSIQVQWMDPKSENRYGEQKQYDPGLPVFADWLPHVLSLIGTLSPNLPQSCKTLEFFRGGAHIELELKLGDIPCHVQLIRNGNQRQRIFEVETEKEMLRLDFSTEPGMITSGSTVINGDPDWETKKRPVAQMLSAFLKGAAGDMPDHRLNSEIGLRANQLIDQTSALYYAALRPWLINKLADFPNRVDSDLRYALSEILYQ